MSLNKTKRLVARHPAASPQQQEATKLTMLRPASLTCGAATHTCTQTYVMCEVCCSLQGNIVAEISAVFVYATSTAFPVKLSVDMKTHVTRLTAV